MKKTFPALLLLALCTVCLSAATAFSASLFPGYEKISWGTDFHTISRRYPNGTLGQIGDQIIYKQIKPDRIINQRTFGFRENKLNAVSVTFNPTYIKKIGIEKLLAKQKKSYGEGSIDRSAAPHMISCTWEDARTRITLAYSPTRPDMTVLMFQQK